VVGLVALLRRRKEAQALSDEVVHWAWTCGTGGKVRWYRASPTQLSDAWTAYTDWVARWWRAVAEPIAEVHGSGAQMFAHLEPGYDCYLVAETKSGWTAVVSAGNRMSWAVADLVPCLMADIESGRAADGVVSRVFRVTGPGTDFSNKYTPTRADRIVSCDRDEGRWSFHTSGQPLDFEETDRYLLRNRGERLTTEMLRRYADALGIPIGEDEVLTGNGLYLRAVPSYPENLIDGRAAMEELARMCASRQELGTDATSPFGEAAE
jgi:hypothetical protein